MLLVPKSHVYLLRLKLIHSVPSGNRYSRNTTEYIADELLKGGALLACGGCRSPFAEETANRSLGNLRHHRALPWTLLFRRSRTTSPKLLCRNSLRNCSI